MAQRAAAILRTIPVESTDAGLYPDTARAGFGAALTEQRVNELQQIRIIERNRGCRTEDE
jgi:hypothetical protein